MLTIAGIRTQASAVINDLAASGQCPVFQTRTFTSPLASAPGFHVAEELLFVAKLLERDDDCADTYRCLTTLLMVQGPRGEDPVPLITPSDCVRSNVNLPHWTLMPLRPTILPVRGRSRL